VSVNHSKHVAEQFNAAGIPAAHCDGQTAPDVRDAILEDFRNGKLLLLSNVELFGEGFDVPGIEAVIMLRPTQSVALYLQQVGRSLRPAPGKERAIILDHAGNIERHGRPDDLWAWDLQGKEAREKRSKSKRLSMTICPECFAAQPAGASRCVICGHAFALAGGDRAVKQVAGELVEHKSRVKDPRFQITEADLARMFRRKGMPEAMCIALAAKTFKARQAKQGVAA
jgi:superfamily II DNA or RNA helicase